MTKLIFLFQFNVYFLDESGNDILETKQVFRIKRNNQTRAFDYICKKVHAQNSIYNKFRIELNNRTFINLTK